ncbi:MULTISPECIES: tRNA lysidine(34) synthetase TilS [unclassified Marinomonas]|uniref:tRNA lysidine(34) synthetase TilS n=1 Tax=unclassified Marinomonas TaxID=196814 RepID=UPI0007AF45BB|nr:MULTISPECIES: tRNA lysidine(34) synthetase TilS [unclassified Marinomonas]
MQLFKETFEMSLEGSFQNYLKGSDKPILIGLSGGVDSVVLLHLLVELGLSERLKAIHIHHGLSENADDWLSFCDALCHKYQVAFQGLKVELNTQKHSIEEAARVARYDVFARHLSEGAYLLLAHHAGDQAETLMFRLLRGTGGKGLAGMPETRTLSDGYLYRPLLPFDKNSLIEYAKQNVLDWVEDESNRDEIYSRNHIRHRIIPALQTFEKEAELRIEQAARRLAFDYQMLSNLSQEKLAKWQAIDGSLYLGELAVLTQKERTFWLRQYLELFSLSLTQAQVLALDTSFFSQQDKQPCFKHKQARLMRFQGRLYVLPANLIDQNFGISLATPVEREYDFYHLSINDKQALDYDDFCLAVKPESCDLLLTNGHSRKLKKWFNDEKIPVWWREHLPYLFYKGELVAIANIWVKPSFQTRIDIKWQPKTLLTWPKI